ncbi:MAG: DUF2782 domain-containing protein [Gammaproteobacteria bacterium]
MRAFILSLALALPVAAMAADEPPAVPEPPPLPEPVESGEVLEPEITIIQREQDRVEEFRVRGQLYMVKITPRRGAPYYLIDTDGDGQLETRRSELEPDMLIPNWVLFSW